MPIEAAEDRRESKPLSDVMEHVDCLLEPRLDTGEGVSSMGTLLLALAMEEFCGRRNEGVEKGSSCSLWLVRHLKRLMLLSKSHTTAAML